MEQKKACRTLRALTAIALAAIVGCTTMPASEYRARAYAKRKGGDPEGALLDLNKAIDLDPTDGGAYWVRAILKHAYLKDTAGSLPDYNRAIELRPNWRMHRQRADVYRNLNRYDEAVADYRQTAELHPNDDISRRYLAKIYTHNLKDREAAIQAWYDLATVYLRQKKGREAVDALTQMKILDDKHELVPKLIGILSSANIPIEVRFKTQSKAR
jgi:tetratricopeptide (TPR) repeat protein